MPLSQIVSPISTDKSSVKESCARVLRIDFDLMDDPNDLNDQLQDLLSANKSIKVILDEVTWMPATIRLLKFMKSLSKNIVIWCAGMLEEFCPEGFTNERLYVSSFLFQEI